MAAFFVSSEKLWNPYFLKVKTRARKSENESENVGTPNVPIFCYIARRVVCMNWNVLFIIFCDDPIFICLILCWVLKSLHRYLFGVLSVQVVQCYIRLLEHFNSSILWRFWRFFKIKCSFNLTTWHFTFTTFRKWYGVLLLVFGCPCSCCAECANR